MEAATAETTECLPASEREIGIRRIGFTRESPPATEQPAFSPAERVAGKGEARVGQSAVRRLIRDCIDLVQGKRICPEFSRPGALSSNDFCELLEILRQDTQVLEDRLQHRG